MKTPMQELIEQLKEERDLHGYERGLHYETAIELAEALLEKEKEVIIEASKNSYICGYLDNQAKVDDSMNFPQDYYNKTFKTKER